MTVAMQSIDNMYEDDGVANLIGTLNAILIFHPKPSGFLGLTPEYDERGVLQRVNVLYVADGEAPSAELDEIAADMRALAAKVQAYRRAACAAAMPSLDDLTLSHGDHKS